MGAGASMQPAMVQLYKNAAAKAEARESRAGAAPEAAVQELATAAAVGSEEQLFQKCLCRRAQREESRALQKDGGKEARQRQVLALREKAMEAAFDNEVESLLKLFDEGVEPDCADDHGTTLLSEAAAGGAAHALEVLLGEGADPNSLGRYRRTPLWRAAYGGHDRLVRTLLRQGADPRECNEQGERPVDVASNAPARELLLCWDTSTTDRLQKESAAARKQKAEDAEHEQREKQQRQTDELDQAVEEAERKVQVARGERDRTRKLLADYRQQKGSLSQQGAEGKLAELEPLLEGAEVQLKIFNSAVQEWEWKVSRAKLKRSDFHQAKMEQEAKKVGKLLGFKIDVICAGPADLEGLLPHLTNELEVKEDFVAASGAQLMKGDALIKEAPFSHLRQSEFTKAMLAEYGKDQAPEVSNSEKESFPLQFSFSHGFDRTINIKGLADVLLKDVGGARQEDGRWPLVLDPSGRTSTFIQYTGAAVFYMADLSAPGADTSCLRRALLKGLLHGGCVLIDLGDFKFGAEVIEEPFSSIEKGLFRKLVDRSVLYSYLLPRRFHSLITKELEAEFSESMFLDEAIAKFVFGFVTSVRDPDWMFARQFYSISIKGEESGEE